MLIRRYLKKAFDELKPRLNSAAPLLLAVCFVLIHVAIWWAGPWLTLWEDKPLDSIAERIMGSLLFTLICFAFWGYLQWKKYKQLAKENDRIKNIDTNPNGMIIENQREDLNSVMDRLKSTLNKRNYLYALPWYLVVGVENSGKTSMIERSGQRFALSSMMRGSGYKRKNSHGFDWWIGDESVLIDPHGELLSQEDPSERALWLDFVKWLSDTRSRRPLNGLILNLDMAALSNGSASERDRITQIMRSRLSELTEQLSTRLPLYIVFTKIDKLYGFEAFFRNYTREQRERVLGFTFTLDSVNKLDAWLEEFDKNYQDFIARINQSLPKTFMHNTLDSRENAAVFSFSRQIAGMRPVLKNLLKGALSSSRFATPALVRGAYFTSVYQQNTPFNAFINSAAKRYGLSISANSSQKADNSTTFFIRRLFGQIIYPEAGIASDCFRVAKQKKQILWLSSITCGIASILLIGSWQHYYTKNTHQSDAVLTSVDTYKKKYANDINAESVEEILAPLNTIRKATLEFGFFRQRPHLISDLGLYQGHTIGPKVEETYLKLLEFRFLPVLMRQLAVQLAWAKTEDEKLERLRVFRMLVDQSGRYNRFINDYFSRTWQKEFAGDRETQVALLGHLDYAIKHTDLTADRAAGDKEADRVLLPYDKLIAKYQKELGTIPVEYRVYRNLKQTAGILLGAPLNLKTQIGPVFDLVFQDNKETYQHMLIPQFLTKHGYQSYFLPKSTSISELALIDSWVLGQSETAKFSDADKASLEKKIRAQYINDYTKTWRSSLNSINVKYFTDINDAVSVLDNVTGDMLPFNRLLTSVKENTHLFPPMPDNDTARMSLMKTPKYRTAAMIDKSFADLTGLLNEKDKQPAYISEVMDAISQLQAYLKLIQDAPDIGKAALEATKARILLKDKDPIYQVKRIASGLPIPMNKWVNKLADESWYAIKLEAIKYLEVLWQKDVYSVYQQKLANRYPFNPRSRKDVSLKDFESFFAPDGVLNRFYQDQLKLLIDENINIDGGDANNSLISKQVLKEFKQARSIQDAFFNRKGILGVEFAIEPLELSANKRRSQISIDGQYINYSHGPRKNVEILWPNTLRGLTSSHIALVPDNSNKSPRRITRQGPWSFFRLLDQSQVVGSSSINVDYRFNIDNGYMVYRLHQEGDSNPFTQNLLSTFKLSKNLY